MHRSQPSGAVMSRSGWAPRTAASPLLLEGGVVMSFLLGCTGGWVVWIQVVIQVIIQEE